MLTSRAMRMRALIGALLVAAAALPALALVASADEGPPLPPGDAGPPLRPPLTVLRAAATMTPDAVVTNTTRAGSPTRELIVLVGGYGSRDNAPAFNTFKTEAASNGFEVLEFGRDFGVYDTYGPVCENAERLRDAVRTKSASYGAVHLVTHSMGGVVADCAFALGLSSTDGVATYVAWASPHDGSQVARTVVGALTLSGPAREDTLDFTARFPMPSPDTAAMHDLARVRAIAPPSGVTRLDLRLATDGVVSSADARDPGVPSRVLLPRTDIHAPRIEDLEGHGGILRNDEAIDLTMSVIRTRSVPPDDRGVLLRSATDLVAQAVDDRAAVVWPIVCGICLLGGVGCLMYRTFEQALPHRSLRRFLSRPFTE